MKRIIYISVFLVPFIFLSNSFYPMVFPKVLFIEAITLILGTLWICDILIYKTKYRIPRNIVFLIFGLYVGSTILSYLNAFVPSLSFWGTMDQGTSIVFMLCILFFSLIVSSLFKTREEWTTLFTAFVLSGIIFTIGSLLSQAGVHFSKVLSISAMSGFLIGNSSWTGIFIAFVFFVSLGLAFAGYTKSQRVIGIIGLITSFFDPTLTGFVIQAPGAHFGFIGLARTASYSLFAGVGIFALYLFFRKIESLKFRKIFLFSIGALFVAGIISLSVIGLDPVRNIIAKNAGPNRLVFWDIAIKGFKEKPLLGWGIEGYQFVYAKNFNPIVTTPGYAPEFWVDRSHNIYFDELVSGGIVGFISLVTLYIVILFGLIRKAILDRGKDGLLFAAILSGVVAFLIQGLMFFQIIIGWFIIAIIIAFVANFCFIDKQNNIKVVKKDKKTDDAFSARHIFAILAIVVFCILLNYLVIKPYKINRGLGMFPVMSYTDRMNFYQKLNNAYIGNSADLGNAFIPYHMKLRKILIKGIGDNEKKLAIKELESIISVLDNGFKKEQYVDVKSLLATVEYYSLLTALKDGAERQEAYDKGMFYLEKIKSVSSQNPIPKTAQILLDASLQYGEGGLDIFE